MKIYGVRNKTERERKHGNRILTAVLALTVLVREEADGEKFLTISAIVRRWRKRRESAKVNTVSPPLPFLLSINFYQCKMRYPLSFFRHIQFLLLSQRSLFLTKRVLKCLRKG
jgi:hypothetical protein